VRRLVEVVKIMVSKDLSGVKPKTALGRNLLHYLLDRGMNYYQFGKLIGRHPGYLSRIIEDGMNPGPKNLKLISEKIGVSVDDLLSDSPSGKKNPTPEEARPGADERLSNIIQEVTELKRIIEQPNVTYLPHFGVGPASVPIDFYAEAGEIMPVPSSHISGYAREKLFTLTIAGDSLIEDGIEDGDTIVVLREVQFMDGYLYVVNVRGNGCTVKYVYHTPDGRARLVPANRNYKEMLFPFEELDIVGKVEFYYKPPVKINKRSE